MRVLLIAEGFPSTSRPDWGRKRLQMAEKLVERGHDVGVVTLDGYHEVVSDVYKGIHVFRVPAIDVLPHIFYPVPDLIALATTLRSLTQSFDVLHFFKQVYLSSFLAYLDLDRPKVLTIDNFPGLDYEHGEVITDFGSFIYAMTLGKLVLRTFDRFISLCKISVGTAIRLGVDERKIQWIPNGIDTDRIRPNFKRGEMVRQKLGLERPICSFVGRLSTVKGLVYLARAARILDKKGVKGNLLIIGEGIERKRFSILEKNENLKIHFLGYQKNPIDFMQASDFVVLPSLGEGCPSIVLEASAIGKPVIGSRVGGIPDLVHNMETGILINPKDVKQLVEAMHILFRDSHQAEIMGKKARMYAEKELDWNIIVSKYEKLYEQLTNP